MSLEFLKKPILYNLIQLFFSHRKMKVLLTTELLASHKKRVLDIGCGTGQSIEFLPECKYTGFDISIEYLTAAKKTHGTSFNFVLSSIEEFNYEQHAPLDIVLLIGVLHHLNDQQIKSFYKTIKTYMNEDSFLLSVDPCFVKNQRKLARFLVSLDRGDYIRTIPEYQNLTQDYFVSTTSLHCPQTFPPYDRLMQKLTI
jgi:2-polyprenyl-3-methyl-5-hydroxy-6-metoxy-1,4-benzoquinol methylase